MLDNLERAGPARHWPRSPGHVIVRDADRMRGPLRRELSSRSASTGCPGPPTAPARWSAPSGATGTASRRSSTSRCPACMVPAHLYRPGGPDAARAGRPVLSRPLVARQQGSPDFQAFCINMARLGFVVLSFDPFGQGERGVSSRDHRRTEALLVGVAQQGFAEYETRCALEYLLSRKEVDPRRVGITGASGGGFNTWITAALDDRIAAAVPVVGTSEFAEQIHVCRPLDWYHAAEHCHFVPGLIRYANNHELLAMAAPKPVLIVAAARGPELPARGRAAGRRLRPRALRRPTAPATRSAWSWTLPRGTATSGSSARRRMGGSSAG